MAEASKGRLVRCPKCENLLPEPPGFSVYQCGGCGAVLRAKKKELLGDGLLGTSDEERSRGASEKGDVDNVGLGSVAGAKIESNGIVKRNNCENVLNGSSSSGVDNSRGLDDCDGSKTGRDRLDLGFDQDRKIRYSEDEYKHPLKGLNDEYVRDNGTGDFRSSRPDYTRLNKDELEEIKRLIKLLRSRPAIDQNGMDRNSSIASRANASSVAGQGRFVNFQHPEVGPSNYVGGSYYNYAEQRRYGDRSDGLARVENLENDRVELLRKLDELADQLTRSCDVADKSKERIHHDRWIPPVLPDAYDRHDAFVQDGTRNSYTVHKQPLIPDKHISRAPYVPHSHGYVPYTDRHGIPFQESYPPRNFSYEYGGITDAYQTQMLRRPSHQPPSRYFQESCYEQFPGHVDFNQDLFMSHPHEAFFHQPACSCLQCVNKNWQVSSKIQPPNLCSQNMHSTHTSRSFYQNVNPITYDPQVYTSEASNLLPPQSRDRKHLTRSSSDLGREKVGFGQSHPKKVVAAPGGRRLFQPIAGGAPFVTCCNCFELLKLPRKLFLTQKNPREIKCGGCSSVLLFELDGKGIVVSVSATTERVFKKVHSSSSEISDEKYESSHDPPDADAVGNCDGYENFNYGYQLTDAEPVPSSGEYKLSFGESEMRRDPNSFTASSSEGEQSPNSVIAEKDEGLLHLPDSPSQKHPGHSPDNLMHKYGQGNKSKRIEEDRNTADGKISRQNSLKDTLVATEMDVSYNDGSTHDSAEIRKEEYLPKINKGGESFFVGLIKRSFGDFSRSSKSTESGKSNVSINGHFVPDRVVKKAEKLSGTIQPGEYWYDIRAGFWGVMGHPCLGIILPNIEEFNYPMLENCAGGNTEVFVNGRELHQKDLDLLASRGLPITRHKSYLIDISGRVVDENTGEELDGLGKLAPTVQRAKHGFGMRIPKSLLQKQR
ncbi:uncharacterized protein [Coffea arabica]|uniref:Uncharacterized protein n=1 Tax=Coffea arabica TaxID=13443 RepID=A0A6P6TWI4_COFAR|nr:protein ENHANCED DISEASE RESISTANCE 4-like [Coffea arabica]